MKRGRQTNKKLRKFLDKEGYRIFINLAYKTLIFGDRQFALTISWHGGRRYYFHSTCNGNICQDIWFYNANDVIAFISPYVPPETKNS